MEKIQIRFKESDYNVYYDYCLKYYQIHDTVRKQSIHAFLDLFEKGIIPVEEQDIQQARRLLSRKCDEIKKEYTTTRREGDATIPLQMRVCSDLLLFIEDGEKIFRLIQKQGVVANYLMILATFSRVIEENKYSHLFVKYDLKNDVIESLACPLADIIQMRLGTNREWHRVLREFAFIAAQFNQRSSELKFDLDSILLVAPAVVSYFNKEVTFREIASVMPSYFDEYELEEFESFLNRTPDLLNTDQDADISWDEIYEPLKVVVGAVAAQRDRWSQGSPELSGQYLPVPPSGILSPGEGHYPVRGHSSTFPSLPQENGYKTFDIAVSPDLTHQAEPPPRVYPPSDTAPVKPGIHPFIPIIMGVAVILVFIFGTMIVSGDWNFTAAGNTTNPAAGTVNNTTTVKPAAPSAPEATTATPATTPSSTPTTATSAAAPAPTPKSYSSEDIGNHLVEIAFGPDNNIIQKPQKDLIAIAYTDKYNESDIVLLNNFIDEFNYYSTTTKISINIELTSPADIWLDFLPETSLSQIKTDQKTSVYKNLQTGTYYFIRNSEKTYVNSDLTGDERKRWILRGLLNNLGFYGETATYSDSIFYSGTNNASHLSDIDLKAMQLMYGKKITNGMTKSSVESII